MKKIVPFNNVLTFNTDVREITAISLEHDIKTEEDAISGTFYITGEYKITDGQLDKEKFSFELPFDIALGCNYNLDTIVVDIDDFRYELLDRNKLKVNIDLYIDGEVIEPVNDKESEETDPLFTEEEIREMNDNMEEESTSDTEEAREPVEDDATPSKQEVKMTEEPIITPISDDLDLLDEMLKDKKEEKMEDNKTEINIENENENNNENINIFNGFNEEEQYVTYHVYPVTENDTLDKIMEKYNVTKEDLGKYNNIEDIHPGDKLIIPANNNDK